MDPDLDKRELKNKKAKEYYAANREIINKRRRVQAIKQARKYYEDHKEEVLTKQKRQKAVKRLLKKLEHSGQPDLFMEQGI